MDELRRLRQLGLKAKRLRAEAKQVTSERDALVHELIAGRRCTQAEIGRTLGLTREQVRRIFDTEQRNRGEHDGLE